jgi:single-strand DNA-binding protein
MYQNIILIGNAGRDPELQYTPAGKAVAKFSLATTEMNWKPAGESTPMTTWWTITCWCATAERIAEQLHKGNRVLVEGRVKPDSETGNPRIFTRKDGSTGSLYELTASVVRILEKQEKQEPEGDEEVMW